MLTTTTTATCEQCGISSPQQGGNWDDHIHDGWTGLPDSWSGTTDGPSVRCDDCGPASAAEFLRDEDIR